MVCHVLGTPQGQEAVTRHWRSLLLRIASSIETAGSRQSPTSKGLSLSLWSCAQPWNRSLTERGSADGVLATLWGAAPVGASPPPSSCRSRGRGGDGVWIVVPQVAGVQRRGSDPLPIAGPITGWAGMPSWPEQEVAELADGRNEPPAAHPDTVGRQDARADVNGQFQGRALGPGPWWGHRSGPRARAGGREDLPESGVRAVACPPAGLGQGRRFPRRRAGRPPELDAPERIPRPGGSGRAVIRGAPQEASGLPPQPPERPEVGRRMAPPDFLPGPCSHDWGGET